METAEQQKVLKGGEFLIRETEASEVFIPEEWSEEQKMIAQSCYDFVAQEIHPRLDEIDSQKDPELMPSLLDKAGEIYSVGKIYIQIAGLTLSDAKQILKITCTRSLIPEPIRTAHLMAAGISKGESSGHA